MATIEQLTQENDKLRLLLATSKADCAYCGLPAEAMAKCASGFPGCSRADDMLSDGTPTRQDLIDARDALAAQNVRLREALERATDAAKSYRSDILGCSGDNPNPRNESWMEGMCYAPKWEGRDSSIDIAVAALAFPLPQAAREVAEWRRDSERLTQMIDVSNDGHGIIDDGTWDLTPIDEDDAQVAARVAIDAAIDAARAEAERLKAELQVEESNCAYPDFSCGTFAIERGIELRPGGGPTYTTTVEHWQGLLKQLTAAQAGEARAVEALRRIAAPPGCGCKPICRCRTLESRSVELEAKMDIATEVAEASQPALDWLAQREREAAAAELEGMWERWCSNESYEPNFPELWRFVFDRAAALRAAKGGE